MNQFVFTHRQLEDYLTQAVKVTIGHLYDEEFISVEDAKHLLRTRLMVLKKPSQFVGNWKKLFGVSKDELMMVVAAVDDGWADHLKPAPVVRLVPDSK